MKTKKILYFLLLLGFLSGCDYLDIVPDNLPTLEMAFNNKSSAERFLFTCYSFVPEHGKIGTDPGAGQKVKEGRTIYLTINTLSIPLRAIPDVADNSSLRQAQAKVLAAGFKLTEIQLMNGEKDWVYGIKYQGRSLEAGDKVPLGAALTLMVGNGENEPLESDSIENVEGTEEPATSESSSSQDDSWF